MLKRIGLGGASVAFLASLTIVLPNGVVLSATAASTITGASQAACTPAPCAPPTGLTSYTLTNVPNGDGTTSTREYGVYRPANLTPSATNLAPAILVFYQAGTCGLKPSGRFASLAPKERFIVVYMEVPCEREEHNWHKRNVDPTTSTAVNDEPYVTAVVQAIKECPSSGANPNQCVDPRRIYAAGASSGGNMVADVMCDVQNSPSFRGYLIDSSSLQLFNGAPACPSSNRSFFVMMALSNYSIDGGLYYNTARNPHLDVPLFADWAASRLGCAGERVDDAIGSPVASTLRNTYSGPCAYAVAGSRAVVTLGVQNGGHTWSCQDSDAGAPTPSNCSEIPNPPGLTPDGLPYTNGLFIEEDFWNFVAQGVSTEATATPLEETTPPAVSVTSPSNGSTVSGTVSIDVQATDDVEVAGVRLELDGTDLGPPTPAGAEGAYSLTWNTTTVANGSHVLRALANDRAGNLTIASTLITVDNTPPSSISPPVISGSAAQGQTLTEAHGSWESSPTGYDYQWQDCDSTGASCAAIAGATGQTYTLTATDVGHTIRVQETASNAYGTGGPASQTRRHSCRPAVRAKARGRAQAARGALRAAPAVARSVCLRTCRV